MELTCNRCGGEFTATRSDAKYCSAACRVAAHRLHARNTKPAVTDTVPVDVHGRMMWSQARYVLDDLATSKYSLVKVRKREVDEMVSNLRTITDYLEPPATPDAVTDAEMLNGLNGAITQLIASGFFAGLPRGGKAREVTARTFREALAELEGLGEF